jgi:hypothetical protein
MIPTQLRDDLIRYLLATSVERARFIGELTERNPGMADVLAEGDDDLGAKFEIELLGRRAEGSA